MKVRLPNGQEVEMTPEEAKGLIQTARKKTKDKRKTAEEFMTEQPWLSPYLKAGGLSEVKDAHGHLKQAVRNVPCQAGKLVQYTSQYQELDRTHLERSHEGGRELRSADFTHLPLCNAVLGSGGFLRSSDFHQTLLCSRCQTRAKQHRAKMIRDALKDVSLKRAREEHDASS